MKELKILDIINTRNAVIHKFGIQVYEVIKPFLQNNQSINLSFEGLKNVTSGFTNASIGKLYIDFPNAGDLLKLTGLEDHIIWKEKVDNAISLATNQDKARLQNKAISDLLTS